MNPDDFLQNQPGPRPWHSDELQGDGIEPIEIFLGEGRNALEVAVAHATQRPTRTTLRKVWKARHGHRASPLLLVVLWRRAEGARAWLCGPVGDEPPVYEDLDISQAERIAQTALEQPDRHNAIRLLRASLPETESELPGIRNVGMFATYHLRERVSARPDWQEMGDRGRALLSERGRDLVQDLGFEIESRGATTHVLRIRANRQASAVAIFLDENESPERLSGRFRESTPVSTALAMATAESLRFVVLTRGSEIRLYGTSPQIGVGRKGRAETYIEANLALLPEEAAGYLPLIFGAEALLPGGSFEKILDGSRDFAAGIGARLRDRVYDRVVPALALAVGRQHVASDPDEAIDAHLDEVYETAMTILFRLLFVAYAEDKDLLPYGRNDAYRQHALKTLARWMADAANRGELRYDEGALTYWHRAEELWHAVDRGSDAWGVPMYNGGLFSTEAAVSPVGGRIAELEIPDETFGPVLFDLLVEESEDGIYGPVDFAALSVREFGTIYEGLLESSLAVAKENLKRDSRDQYVPAEEPEEAAVHPGEVFLQGNDGARKATGSYFTRHFAVEYLLDHSLVPALERHLDRIREMVDEGKAGAAAKEFFNFRVADIAMGSGHFLVSAVDRIEIGMSDFLERNPLPGVTEELERLRAVAEERLGQWGEGETIERASLLRRQIARRCVYGVDINHVAVELARVSLWIHTFVEGLPLSFLDRTLVHGDSLFGAANAEEARALLSPGGDDTQFDAFSDLAQREVDAVRDDLERLARSSDATEAEIRGARQAFEAVRERLLPLREALDIAVASTVDEELTGRWLDHVDRLLTDRAFRQRILNSAEEQLLEPRSVHFPLEFPEVFYRSQRGFDCVVGNPPWEEVTVEHDRFWLPYLPGLGSMPEAEKRDRIEAIRSERPDLAAAHQEAREKAERVRDYLTTDRFPGMGTGDPDLYKAFGWRFLAISSPTTGGIGVVTPRALFQAAGSADFRKAVLDGTRDVQIATLVNNRGWVFPDVHPQYSIVLATMVGDPEGAGRLRLLGPYSSKQEFDKRGDPAELTAAKVAEWNDKVTLPLLPGERSGKVLERLMAPLAIGSQDRSDFIVRPVAEAHATNDKVENNPEGGIIVIAEERPQGHVPVHGGEAFDLWQYFPDRVYGWADPDHADRVLFEKRKRQVRHKRSAFHGLDPEIVSNSGTLPSRHPRLVFRDVTNRTNTRTMIAGVAPEGVYLTNKAPYLYFVSGGGSPTEAYVLGVLGSRILDWVTRRYVEINMNFYLFNSFRVPVYTPGQAVSQRVVEIAGALSCQQEELNGWASALGRQVEPLDQATQANLEAELDAVVAHLYGLDRDDVVHIMETFHSGWDYEAHLATVLDHYESWSEKLDRAPSAS